MNKLALIVSLCCSSLVLHACGGGSSGYTGSQGGGGGTSSATHFSVTNPATAISGSAFNFTVTALDNSNSPVTSYTGTVHFTSSDSRALLPANSTLNNGTAIFSATLNTTGNQTITASDTVNSSIKGISNSTDVTNNQGPSLAITSGNPPNGTDGIAHDVRLGPKCKEGTPGCNCVPIPTGPVCHLSEFGFPLTAAGGEAPYTWGWVANADSILPPGLDIATVFGGVSGIGGTPTTAGTYGVIVTVADSATPPAHASATYSITISPPPPPVIDITNSPSAGVNLQYSFAFTAFQGQPPLTWSESGALPQGLTFNPEGVLSGKPSVTGTFPISVMVQDSAGQKATPQNFTVDVFLHGFAPTSTMESTRSNFTATLLNIGKVLVAGGQDSTGGTLASTELYDPSGGTFTSTGSMGAARTWHTATSLGNGKVLVSGGFGADGNAISTAELYDPTTRTFSPAGSMETARTLHAATRLSSGKVLVTGGYDANGTPISSSELYDPSTGTFTATGSMQTPRYFHIAIELTNGDVLVAGGVDANGNILATAELYDPTSGTFSPTGTMESARSNFTATLLNIGKVLVAGGADAISQGVASAELYDPASGTFSSTGSMAVARARQSAIEFNDGTVLLVGGVDDNGPLTSAELFDPKAGQFTLTGGLQTPRFGQAAALLGNGKVLVAGGGNAITNSLASAELYQ